MSTLMKLYRDNALRKHAPTNLVGSSGGVAEIYIYDVISADWGLSALDVIAAIAQVKDAATLNIHINSPGGEVFEGRAIMAAIRTFQGKTVAMIDSLCASAATSIALACDEVQMSDGAFFMIHNAHGAVFGDKNDMRERADMLEKVESALVADYVAKTGKTADEIAALMNAETWYTAKEALESGFIDSICEPTKTKNAWNLAAYANPPKALTETPHDAKVEAPTNDAAPPEQREFLARKLRVKTLATNL